MADAVCEGSEDPASSRQFPILEAELEAELAQRRAELHVSLERGRAFFEEEILRRHRELRTRLSTYLLNAPPLVVLTAPVIYAVIVPLVLLDLFVSIYQRVCFPVYEIPTVNRGDYLIFDRHHLAYLNALEKLNCAYCSYANGLIAYVREIAGRTERIGVQSSTPGAQSGLIPAITRSRTMATPKNTGNGSSNSSRTRRGANNNSAGRTVVVLHYALRTDLLSEAPAYVRICGRQRNGSKHRAKSLPMPAVRAIANAPQT